MTPNRRPRRVVILNDHEAFRRAAVMFVSLLRGFTVAASGGIESGIAKLIAAARPDVVLLDQTASLARGLALARRVKEIQPEAAVILMPLYAWPDHAKRYPQGPVDAVVGKDQFREQLPLVLARLFA